jgi:hypothetical protein
MKTCKILDYFRYFERIMLVIIILNSILMFFYNYSINICNHYTTTNREECLIKYDKDIQIDNLLDKINIFFMGAYIIEFSIKLIAMGFVLEKFTYLREPWYMLDFLIIIIGTMNYFYKENLFRTFSFKLFRLLHPFRNMKIAFLEGMFYLIKKSKFM